MSNVVMISQTLCCKDREQNKSEKLKHILEIVGAGEQKPNVYPLVTVAVSCDR